MLDGGLTVLFGRFGGPGILEVLGMFGSTFSHPPVDHTYSRQACASNSS